jgi:hypothetical protein
MYRQLDDERKTKIMLSSRPESTDNGSPGAPNFLLLRTYFFEIFSNEVWTRTGPCS